MFVPSPLLVFNMANYARLSRIMALLFNKLSTKNISPLKYTALALWNTKI